MSLLGLIEITVLAGAIVGIGSSLIIAYAIRKSNKALLEHQEKASFDMLEQQKTINSAKLSLNLLEFWKEEKYAAIQDFLYKLNKSKESETDIAINSVLHMFEDIAVLWRGGTLTDTHVKEFFGSNIRDIRKSKIMQERIEEESKHNPDFILVNLRALLRKSEKRNV